MQELTECPNCNSKEIIKYGFAYRKDGKIQQYRCKKCFCIFNEE